LYEGEIYQEASICLGVFEKTIPQDHSCQFLGQ
jgi:hypothetical protein